MKNSRVMITGKHGYLSNSLSEYLTQAGIANETVSVRDPDNLPDFTGVETVVHMAGIVHEKAPKEDYYRVNTVLTLRLAKKARSEGVKQFIFVGTAAVYESWFSTVITKATKPKPANDYAKSKLLAEKGLKAMASRSFIVAIVRLPMVYGYGCPGNFSKLIKLAKLLPLFPYVENQRSMLYSENLNEFMRLLISSRKGGMFFPQNSEYVNTSRLYSDIRKCFGKKTVLTKFMGKVMTIKGKLLNLGIVNKLFGTFVYSKSISDHFDNRYNVVSYEESIVRSCLCHEQTGRFEHC